MGLRWAVAGYGGGLSGCDGWRGILRDRGAREGLALSIRSVQLFSLPSNGSIEHQSPKSPH